MKYPFLAAMAVLVSVGAVAEVNHIYQPPMSTLYIGGAADGSMPECGAQFQPAKERLTWWNNDAEADAVFSWGYPEGLTPAAESADRLTLEFPLPPAGPCVQYTPITLTAEADGEALTYGADLGLMVGGKPIIDGKNYGLLPFDPISCGMAVYTKPALEEGGQPIPIFGYSADTDYWWRLYTANGDPEAFSRVDHAYVNGIINGIIPAERPLVVNGVWLYAKGIISPEAHFNCTVYTLDEEGALCDAIATADITGADLVKISDEAVEGGMATYSLPFAFSQPAVLVEGGSDAGFYAVMVSGFHDDGVEYFAPLMQVKPDPFETCLGFYQINISYKGEEFDALDFVAYQENEYGEMYCSFAMNLDAEYPYIDCPSALSLVDGYGELSLNSFYPAEDLKVTLSNGKPLPEWLSVEGSGRYDEAKLAFTAVGEEDINTRVLVSVPGMMKLVTLTGTSRIASIADDVTPVEAYDLSGRKTVAERPGIYFVRYSDGSVKKTVVR